MQNNKLHIEIFVLIFMFLVMSLSILFIFYYITPHNYVIYDYEPTIKPISTKKITIDTNKEKIIKYKNIKDKKIRFYSSDYEIIPIMFNNKFKSENIYINKNKLILSKNSDLIIKNTKNIPLNIQIDFF